MGNRQNRINLVHIINRLFNNLKVPESWKEGTLTTMYKGKWKKGDPKNDRGITVSSNMTKTAEKMMRDMTACQGGGREGTGTRDHLLILNVIIEKYKNLKKEEVAKNYKGKKRYDAIRAKKAVNKIHIV